MEVLARTQINGRQSCVPTLLGPSAESSVSVGVGEMFGKNARLIKRGHDGQEYFDLSLAESAAISGRGPNFDA